VRPNKISLFLIAATLLGALTAPGAAQTPRKKARPVVIQTDVPYQITLGGDAPDHGVVTLAVGALTTLFTPEPVLQFNCGRPETLDVKQSDDQAKFHAVYLRPTQAAESVTISIEMPSGLVSFFARIVEVPSGAKAGNYSGEILVKPKFHETALERLKADAAALQAKLGDAERRALTAEYERTQARGDAVKARAAGLDAGRRETLTLLERMPHAKASLQRREREWSLALLGAPLRVADGAYFVFEIRHEGKRGASFDGAQAAGRAVVVGREPGPIAPKQSLTIALFVEGEPPAALDAVLDGTPVALPLAKGTLP
jgi:hypothetical protein